MYEIRPFSEEVKALRLGARRRSSGLCVYELQSAEPFYLWRGVAYIECARTPASPRYKEFKVHKEIALLVTLALNALMALKITEWTLARYCSR